jgi:glycosyltransferase involved in cell wall biosynthesis
MNIIGAWNNRSYGIVTRKICKYLKEDIRLWPLHVENVDTELLNKLVNTPYKADISLRIWHQNDLALHTGKVRIGFPIFELDRLTEIEREHVSSQDIVFVPSKWAKEIVGNAEVIPLGYDPEVFYPGDIPKKEVVYVNAGKWEIRKGHDILVEAFAKAFTNENVKLLMLCNNPFLSKIEEKEWQKIYRDKLGNKVEFIPWLDNEKQVGDLFRYCDVGVFPSRAEGWNLEALECLACGCDLIITDYSGHTEFIPDCHKIQIEQTEPAFDGKWFFGQGEWAKMGQNQIDQLVHFLRKTYLNRQSYDVSQYTWENTCLNVQQVLNTIKTK